MRRPLLTVLTLISFITLSLAQEKSPIEKLIQEQFDAYNQRDIEGFINAYSDTVKLYMFPNTLLYNGKEKMRKDYEQRFEKQEYLYAKSKNRIIMGNTVVDHEYVQNGKDQWINAIVIYKVGEEKNGELKILESYFIIDTP